MVVVPYLMPGFPLARASAELFTATATDATIGIVLLRHGIVSFGDTAQIAYERMIELVGRAEEYLEAEGVRPDRRGGELDPASGVAADVAALRAGVAAAAGFPVVLTVHDDEQALSFARRDDVGTIARQGPATPDHVLRTKRVPLVGRDVAAFAAEYQAYFEQHAGPQGDGPPSMLDPAPRVILDPELGMCTVGRTAGEARIVEDIYRHTIDVILGATALEAYEALPAGDVFDVEYWDLEQAKLRQSGDPLPLTGEIALVTGAASGIGRACVEALLAHGAAVAGLDLAAAIEDLFDRPDFLGVRCDVTSEEQLAAGLEATVQRVRRARHARPERRHLPAEPEDRGARPGRVGTHHADQRDCEHRAAESGGSAPGTLSAVRAGRGHRFAERARPWPWSRRLLRLEGGADPGRTSGRARVEREGDPREHGAPARRLRHRDLDARDPRGACAPVRPVRRRVPAQHPAQHRGGSHDVGELVAALCGPVFAKTTGPRSRSTAETNA